jgi:hypothetical protein
MTIDDIETHVGFMDGVLGRAKKVLFPEDEAVGVETVAATSSIAIENPTERRKPKSRARLAATNSMLANMPFDVTECTAAGTLNIRAGAAGAGKENKVLKLKTSGKRGNNIKFDSLAMATSLNADAHPERFNDVNVNNRKHAGRELRQSQQPTMTRAVPVNALSRVSDPTNNSSVISRKNKTIRNTSESDNPFTLGKATSGNIRRRGIRTNTNTASMDSNESTKERIKRYSGPSSLMMLPSSTQKAQKPNSSSNAMHGKKIVSRRNTSDKKYEANRLPPSSKRSSLENIPSADIVHATTLANKIDTLSIGEGQSTCSTPHIIRHRNTLGSITSPPGFLHRLSKLSNPSFFQDHSPLPNSNPNLMKRFDSKKTPANKSGPLGSMSPEISSPCSMVFSPCASEVEGSNPTVQNARLDEDKGAIGEASSATNSNSPIGDMSVSFSPFVTEEEGIDATINNNSRVVGDQEGIGRTSAVAIRNSTSNDPVGSNKFPASSSPHGSETNAVIESELGFGSAVSMEPSSLYSFKRVLETENPAIHAMSPNCRDKEATEPITSNVNLSDAPPPITRNATEGGNGVTAVEVRKSSRNSKPTDRLTVKSWKNKTKKPVQSNNPAPKAEAFTKKEKTVVRSEMKDAVDEGIAKKERPVRANKKVNKDVVVEDGADWESYQAYIQSLLTKNRSQGPS